MRSGCRPSFAVQTQVPFPASERSRGVRRACDPCSGGGVPAGDEGARRRQRKPRCVPAAEQVPALTLSADFLEQDAALLVVRQTKRLINYMCER